MLTKKSIAIIQAETGKSLSELAETDFNVTGKPMEEKSYLAPQDVEDRRAKLKNARFPRPHKNYLSKFLAYFS